MDIIIIESLGRHCQLCGSFVGYVDFTLIIIIIVMEEDGFNVVKPNYSMYVVKKKMDDAD